MFALARERVVGELRQRRDGDGVLPEVIVRAAARDLGCSPRSVRRWIERGLPVGRRQTVGVIDEEMRSAYVRWHGNVAAVHRELSGAGRSLPTLRTLQRAFARELRPAERAAARTGEAGIRAHGLYVQWDAGYRNAVWQGDHKQLDVLVVPPHAKRPVRPWSTMFIDACSRAIMGWAISLRPSAAEVLAALRAAMAIPDAGPALGGMPERLRTDHGLEFCAESVRAASLAVGIQLSLAAAYSPEEKGRIERLHLTCVQTFLSGLPFYTGGRRDKRGRLQDTGQPLLLEELVDRFAAWVIDYNNRPHSELRGRSPAEMFAADPTPLRALAPDAARALLAARKEVKVRRYGISHRGQHYVSPELHELVGETVEIAFIPHDERSVQVYWRGAWSCTAVPQETLTEQQQIAVIKSRRAYAQELRRRQRAATRASTTRLAPMTADTPAPVDVTLAARRRDDPDPNGGSPASEARIDLLVGQSGPPRARRRA